MSRSLDNHFGKRTAWSLLSFLNYAYFDILPIRKFWESVSTIHLYVIGSNAREGYISKNILFVFITYKAYRLIVSLNCIEIKFEILRLKS